MPLTSLRLLVFCILLAVGGPVAVGVILYRSRGLRRPRWVLPTAVAAVVVAQASAVAAVARGRQPRLRLLPRLGLAVRHGSGTAGRRQGRAAGAERPGGPAPAHPPGARAGLRARVATRRSRVKGPVSGVTQKVVAWLPPQYGDRRFRKTRFPVVMVLGGAYRPVSLVVAEPQPGQDRERRRSRPAGSQPFVAIFPEINVSLAGRHRVHRRPGRASGLQLARPRRAAVGDLDAAGQPRLPPVERDGLVHRWLLRGPAPSA